MVITPSTGGGGGGVGDLGGGVVADRGTSSWSSSGGVAVVGKYIVSVGAARKPIYIYNKHITKLLKILIYLRY